ncbi:uncharacterized protein LOC133819255 [Humulus lupulus]|uniref:uncharacterized protein LOC133819255 n=1 Tax=Humulus lupulus TaxID=3486 RepID=UPI002B404819|nr:uncharacterized protein LOC133819255 [Humulus lupulus]
MEQATQQSQEVIAKALLGARVAMLGIRYHMRLMGEAAGIPWLHWISNWRELYLQQFARETSQRVCQVQDMSPPSTKGKRPKHIPTGKLVKLLNEKRKSFRLNLEMDKVVEERWSKCTKDDELKDGASFTHGLLLCIL